MRKIEELSKTDIEQLIFGLQFYSKIRNPPSPSNGVYSYKWSHEEACRILDDLRLTDYQSNCQIKYHIEIKEKELQVLKDKLKDIEEYKTNPLYQITVNPNDVHATLDIIRPDYLVQSNLKRDPKSYYSD